MIQDSMNCKKILEEKIIEQTKTFYQRTCLELLEKESLSGYLQIAYKFYNEEKSRCDRYLIWDIKDKILNEFR